MRNNGDTSNVFLQVIKPLITAIAYLHSRFVMHRDIKPENVLITGDCVVKLCDFGLAINWQKDIAVSRVGTLVRRSPAAPRASSPLASRPSSSALRRTAKEPRALRNATAPQSPPAVPRFPSPSTPLRPHLSRTTLPPPPHRSQEFMAPEIIWLPRRSYQEAQALREKGRSLYTSSVDIWAIGILAYELLYGRTPFNCSKNELVIEKAVRSAPIVFPLQPTISVGAANFIKARRDGPSHLARRSHSLSAVELLTTCLRRAAPPRA